MCPPVTPESSIRKTLKVLSRDVDLPNPKSWQKTRRTDDKEKWAQLSTLGSYIFNTIFFFPLCWRYFVTQLWTLYSILRVNIYAQQTEGRDIWNGRWQIPAVDGSSILYLRLEILDPSYIIHVLSPSEIPMNISTHFSLCIDIIRYSFCPCINCAHDTCCVELTNFPNALRELFIPTIKELSAIYPVWQNVGDSVVLVETAEICKTLSVTTSNILFSYTDFDIFIVNSSHWPFW